MIFGQFVLGPPGAGKSGWLVGMSDFQGRRPGRNFHQSRSNREKTQKDPTGIRFSDGDFFWGIFDDFCFFSVATRVDPTARTTYCTGMQQLLGACPGGGGVKVALWAMGQLGQLDG